MTFENNDLSTEQAAALLRHEVSLSDIYKSFGQIETSYMDVLRDLVENEANDLLREEEKLRNLPIYYHSGRYANENGELAIYREARAANIGCRDAIQEAIKNHYHDNRLDPAAVTEVAEKYGLHRVLFVLANTVRHKEWDGRFSLANKEWANGMYVPEDKGGMDEDRNLTFCVEAHPVLVNGYLNMAREQHLLTQPLSRQEIEAEADRINRILKTATEPNSPNRTHFMAELSPQFLQRAGTKDMEILQRLLPYETLELSALKDRKGIYAMISKDQIREVPHGVKKPSTLNKLRQPVVDNSRIAKKQREPER